MFNLFNNFKEYSQHLCYTLLKKFLKEIGYSTSSKKTYGLLLIA